MHESRPMQACQISGFGPEITAISLLYRLSRENLRQNHKISGIFTFRTTF